MEIDVCCDSEIVKCLVVRKAAVSFQVGESLHTSFTRPVPNCLNAPEIQLEAGKKLLAVRLVQ